MIPDWLALVLAVASPILAAAAALITVGWSAGKRFAIIETTQNAHTEALHELPNVLKGFVTKDTGDGYQAQLNRLERNDAECEGKVLAMRQEAADRVERLSAHVSAHEQTTSATQTALANALTRLEATMSAMKESVDRLSEMERLRVTQPQAPNDALAELHRFVALTRAMKELQAS